MRSSAIPLPAPRRLTVLPVLAALLIPADAASQTILNVERFQMGEVQGLHAGVTLSGSASFGNAEVVNVRTEGIVGHLDGRHWPRVIFGGSYLRRRGDEAILDNQFLQLRYSYILSPVTRTFHFVQLQRNQTLRLRERTLIGSGIRTDAFRSGGTVLNAGTGLMLEREVLDEEAVDPGDEVRATTVRAANLAVLTHELRSGARLASITYFQPRLLAPADFRLLSELALRAPVTEVLSLTASGSWRHDSRPPAALRRNDIGLNVGLSVEMK